MLLKITIINLIVISFILECSEDELVQATEASKDIEMPKFIVGYHKFK